MNKDTLVCTVCREYPVSPIKICPGSHIACGFCSDWSKFCYTCKGDLVTSENAEKIAKQQKIKLKCRNSEEGCKELKLSTEMKVHVTTKCEYRPIRCFLIGKNDCEMVAVPIKELESHLRDIHSTPTFPSDNSGIFTVQYFNFDDMVDTYKTYHVFTKKFDGNIFFIHRMFNQSNDHACQWVSIIGNEELTEKYRFVWTCLRKGIQSDKIVSKGWSWNWNVPVTSVHYARYEDVKVYCKVASLHWKLLSVLNPDHQDNSNGMSYKYNEHLEIVKIGAEDPTPCQIEEIVNLDYDKYLKKACVIGFLFLSSLILSYAIGE